MTRIGGTKTVLMSLVLVFLLLLSGCKTGGDDGDGGNNGEPADVLTWVWALNGTVLEIAYGHEFDRPQLAALHLESGYLRITPTDDSAWGPSVVLSPSFWSGGAYYQGAPITYTAEIVEPNLVINIDGTIGSINFHGIIVLIPPINNTITAWVGMTTTGSVVLDTKPNEAFKPFMISTMYVDDTTWDSREFYVGSTDYEFPESGWILDPAVSGTEFGVYGGTSTWKENSPSISIGFEHATPFVITGWLTSTIDPNDDNVGIWPATDTVLTEWEYDITYIKTE